MSDDCYCHLGDKPFGRQMFGLVFRIGTPDKFPINELQVVNSLHQNLRGSYRREGGNGGLRREGQRGGKGREGVVKGGRVKEERGMEAGLAI